MPQALPAVSDARAAEFLGDFPVEQLEKALDAAHARGPAALEALCSCLSKVLAGEFGARLLPEVAGPVQRMLSSPPSPVRRLGCELLGRIAQDPAAERADLRAGAAAALFGALEDPCTSVAAAAARGLRAMAGSDGGLALVAGPHLARLCRSEGPASVRLRGLQLAVDVAALSESAAHSIAALGALEALAMRLRGREDDELGWLGAVEVAMDLARGNPRGAVAVLGPLSEQIFGGATGGLGARYLGVLAEVAASAAELPGGGWDAAAAAAGANPGLIEDIIGLFGREIAAGEKEEAFGSTSGFGATVAGAELLLRSPAGEPVVEAMARAALRRATDVPTRLAALHALAAVAGAERVAHEGRVDLAGGVLGEAAEDHLRRAVFDAAAGDESPSTPAEVLHGLASRPFTEARVAAYRFVSALAARPWGAQEVLSHTGLLTDLLDHARPDSAREVRLPPPPPPASSRLLPVRISIAYCLPSHPASPSCAAR